MGNHLEHNMRRWLIVSTCAVLGVTAGAISWRHQASHRGRPDVPPPRTAGGAPFRPSIRSPLNPEGEPVGWVFGKVIGVAPPGPQGALVPSPASRAWSNTGLRSGNSPAAPH